MQRFSCANGHTFAAPTTPRQCYQAGCENRVLQAVGEEEVAPRVRRGTTTTDGRSSPLGTGRVVLTVVLIGLGGSMVAGLAVMKLASQGTVKRVDNGAGRPKQPAPLRTPQEPPRVSREEAERLLREKIRQEQADEARARELSQRFTNAELVAIKGAVEAGALGRGSLAIVHPTGIYGHTSVSTSTERSGKECVVRVVVYWKGAITEANYQTTIAWRFTKEAHSSAVVEQDSAVIAVQDRNRTILNGEYRDLWRRLFSE